MDINRQEFYVITVTSICISLRHEHSIEAPWWVNLLRQGLQSLTIVYQHRAYILSNVTYNLIPKYYTERTQHCPVFNVVEFLLAIMSYNLHVLSCRTQSQVLKTSPLCLRALYLMLINYCLINY